MHKILLWHTGKETELKVRGLGFSFDFAVWLEGNHSISLNLKFFIYLKSENLLPSMAVGVLWDDVTERSAQTWDVWVSSICLLTLSDSWYPASLLHSPLLPGAVSGLTLLKCSIYPSTACCHRGSLFIRPIISGLWGPQRFSPGCIHPHFQEHWKPGTAASHPTPTLGLHSPTPSQQRWFGC